jgi:hypothetical protein
MGNWDEEAIKTSFSSGLPRSSLVKNASGDRQPAQQRGVSREQLALVTSAGLEIPARTLRKWR